MRDRNSIPLIYDMASVSNHILRSVCRLAINDSYKYYQRDRHLERITLPVEKYNQAYKELLSCLESYFSNFKTTGISFGTGFCDRALLKFDTIETNGNVRYAQCILGIKANSKLDKKKLKRCAVNASKAFARDLMKRKHISLLSSNLRDDPRLTSTNAYTIVEIISDDESLESRIRLNPMIQSSIIDDGVSEDLDIDGTPMHRYVLVFAVKFDNAEIR